MQSFAADEAQIPHDVDGLVDCNQISSYLPVMTKKEIRKIALEHSGYSTPALNDQLYLHYKGYQKIENLEDYCNLKALWLDSNGLEKIENLDKLTSLRCLFLQRNLLSSLENLESLTSLVQLDVSENRLTRIVGLDVLPHLSNLNVSKNALSAADGIENLTGCKKLSSIDFSHNSFETYDVIDTLSRIPTLLSINMAGNPIAAKVSHFRKKMIVAIKSLRYLDRPIFDMDRASAEAWSIGGRDAELQIKTDWQKNKQEEEASSTRIFRQWQGEVRAKALNEKRQFETDGPTASQMVQEEERLQRISEREVKASEAAAKERDMYRIEIPLATISCCEQPTECEATNFAEDPHTTTQSKKVPNDSNEASKTMQENMVLPLKEDSCSSAGF